MKDCKLKKLYLHKKIKKSVFLYLYIIINFLVLTSCSSVWEKKYKDAGGVMYGMIYDGNDEAVSGVTVKVDGKIEAVSDIQGRFILKFLNADMKEENKHIIRLEKEEYETIEEKIFYDPLSLLHFKMKNGLEIISRCEKYIDEGEYKKGEQMAIRVLQIKGYEDEGFFLKAIIKYKQGKINEAMAALENIKIKENEHVSRFKEKLKEAGH